MDRLSLADMKNKKVFSEHQVFPEHQDSNMAKIYCETMFSNIPSLMDEFFMRNKLISIYESTLVDDIEDDEVSKSKKIYDFHRAKAVLLLDLSNVYFGLAKDANDQKTSELLSKQGTNALGKSRIENEVACERLLNIGNVDFASQLVLSYDVYGLYGMEVVDFAKELIYHSAFNHAVDCLKLVTSFMSNYIEGVDAVNQLKDFFKYEAIQYELKNETITIYFRGRKNFLFLNEPEFRKRIKEKLEGIELEDLIFELRSILESRNGNSNFHQKKARNRGRPSYNQTLSGLDLYRSFREPGIKTRKRRDYYLDKARDAEERGDTQICADMEYMAMLCEELSRREDELAVLNIVGHRNKPVALEATINLHFMQADEVLLRLQKFLFHCIYLASIISVVMITGYGKSTGRGSIIKGLVLNFADSESMNPESFTSNKGRFRSRLLGRKNFMFLGAPEFHDLILGGLSFSG